MWINILGYVASASVLATFCMSTMIPLRLMALASNVLFSAYGAAAHVYPVMILHLILLPINIVRLLQILRVMRGITRAPTAELSLESLIPFMSRRRFKAGETLTRRDEHADRLYYLDSGRVHVRELDKTIGPGNILGEIGVFARDQKRMATVVCLTECEVFELTEAKVREVYFQNPAFGYAVIQIIIARLMESIALSQQQTSLEPGRP